MKRWRGPFFSRPAPRLDSAEYPAVVPSVPDGLRVYAFGDVHGRSDLLKRLRSEVEDNLRENPPGRAGYPPPHYEGV